MNHPGFQEDVVRNWQCAHSLVGVAVTGTKMQWPLAFHLWLSCTCLSASKEGCKWQLTHPCLVFARAGSFVLWACQGSQCSIRAFPQESSFVFVSLVFPWLGFSWLCLRSVTLIPSVCSWRSNPVLPLRTNNAPRALHPAPFTVGGCEHVSCCLASNCH